MMSRAEQTDLYPGERGARSLLLGALVLGSLPQMMTVDLWVGIVFLSVAALRYFGWRISGAVCSPPGRLLLFITGISATYLRHGTLLGLNAGLTFLMLLLTLKIMESKTARDFSVMATLGCFMCVCNLFISQGLFSMLYQMCVVSVILASLARQYSGGAVPVRRAFPFGLRMLGWGLPLAALLFVLVPRQGGAFRINLAGKDVNLSGISDSLSPGSFSEVVLSTDVAFRASFPDGAIPDVHALYWRTNVLFEGKGFNWERGSRLLPVPVHGVKVEQGDVRHRIQLEPHGGKWMPALDRPIHRVRNSMLEAGHFLLSESPIYLSRDYTVHSRPASSGEEIMNKRVRDVLVAVPSGLSAEVRQLARSLRAPTDAATVRSIMRLFRTGGFRYTLSPGTYDGARALDEFLFERRTGYCEHYAAATATLLRAADVPARIVLGYQGGELNTVGAYVIVRQSDAHAWVEAWVEGEGWLRVDPTQVVAPDRISAGFDAFRNSQVELQSGFSRFVGQVGIDSLIKSVRLLWDTLDYYWTSSVVSFDESTQATLLAMAGVASRLQGAVSWLLIVFSVAAFLWTFSWSSRRKRGRGFVRIEYDRVRRAAGSRGLTNSDSEGPVDFFTRAANAFPNARPELREFQEWYLRERYSGLAPSTRERLVRPRTLARSVVRKLRQG